MKNFKFCPFCRTELVSAVMEGRQRLVCPGCSWVNYRNPLPVVSCLVSGPDRGILLIKRGIEPSKGEWALPGGFLELEESPEEAGRRELKEETGLDGVVVGQVGVTTHLSPMYGHLLMIGLEYRVDSYNAVAGDDAEEARFFDVSGLPSIPFPSHMKLISQFLKSRKDSKFS